MPEIVGYCRVSTEGQTLDAQVAELKAAGATKLFAEKKSGARSDRPQLRKALAALGEGDVLMVTGSTGWRAQPATCSTCCTRSRRAARRSSRCTTIGPTRPRRTGG